MKNFKLLATLMSVVLIILLSACSEVETASDALPDETELKSTSYVELPEVETLDKKMSAYFDISPFDEENYANIYLGKKFKYDVTFNEKALTVPNTLEELNKNGFNISVGSDYDDDSYIYAKETVTLEFTDESSAFTALFYNSSNSSVRLKKCNIAKIRIDNNDSTPNFNINGIHNTSAVTDVIDALGTPSHFYAMTDDTYYFDYFILKTDRRNKIRVYVDLINDCVTAVEFSYYK